MCSCLGRWIHTHNGLGTTHFPVDSYPNPNRVSLSVVLPRLPVDSYPNPNPFVAGEHKESYPASRNSVTECGNSVATQGLNVRSSMNSLIRRSTCSSVAEDDYKATELKIKAFLDENVQDLKKLHNAMNPGTPQGVIKETDQ